MPDAVAPATFTPETGKWKGTAVKVHFNPVSLQYTVTNTLKEEGQGKSKKQHVSQSSAKLTMDLVFDTTTTGEDVRVTTDQIARLMAPDDKKVPAIVTFQWGVYTFKGMVEAYKETIDFFAPSGVPLRAAVNLTMAQQDLVFDPSAHGATVDTQGSLAPEPVQVPTGAGGSPADTAARAGNPAAARAIAAANGAESLRFSASASLSVGASVTLGPPVAFATGSAAFGVSAGFGISGGAGIGIGGGAGLSIGGGASAGLSLGAGISGGAGFSAGAGASLSIGGGASAGVSATEGAFAGLRVTAPSVRASAALDPGSLVSGSATAGFGSGGFAVGGQAQGAGSAGLSADVGAAASLKGRISFGAG